MAKKPKKNAGEKKAAKPTDLSPRDKKTLGSLVTVAVDVVEAAQKKRDPQLAIPLRALSNVKFNKTKRMIEMGSAKNARQLFNLNQAKSYMQSLLVAKGCKQLIYDNKNCSLRSLYYMLKHTIAGTKEETFAGQEECDPIIEDMEVTLNALREELHLFAENRGNIAGPIVVTDKGFDIDCARMGSAGYSIPSIMEPDRIQFKKCTADFVLHVEKGTVWNRFNEDEFWKKHNCLITHGMGQPPRGVRRMLYRLNNELKLPVYCLLDNDPWGYYIYSVIKQGSINLAFESTRMAVPDAKFIGIRSMDVDRYQLSDSVKIKLNDTDIKRANQVRNYPWFKDKKPWQKEVETMLANGIKLEVEALTSKSLSFVTETYVPARLKDKDWLD
ncbi:MAG: DNA topoisomerase IV subunit A [Planctomycetales bacterium]|nr:DNA topoisomerase IV subunit A [Planctomycetales bacterium]MBN8623892.1 DNA topoisomerase IV subunit A [Planctomycetota bacterium]